MIYWKLVTQSTLINPIRDFLTKEKCEFDLLSWFNLTILHFSTGKVSRFGKLELFDPKYGTKSDFSVDQNFDG